MQRMDTAEAIPHTQEGKKDRAIIHTLSILIILTAKAQTEQHKAIQDSDIFHSASSLQQCAASYLYPFWTRRLTAVSLWPRVRTSARCLSVSPRSRRLLRKCYVQFLDGSWSQLPSPACYGWINARRCAGAGRGEGDRNRMTWWLWRHLVVAGRLRGNPLPARTTVLDGALPRVEDQRAAALVSLLVCDAGLVVAAKTKQMSCLTQNEHIFKRCHYFDGKGFGLITWFKVLLLAAFWSWATHVPWHHYIPSQC